MLVTLVTDLVTDLFTDLNACCFEFLAHRSKLLFIAPPAANRAGVGGLTHLDGARGGNTLGGFIKLEASVFPR